MKVHFIAIGGSAMHNLALALHDMGYEVTGSDDEIFEPSKGRLAKKGLLPAEIGWHTQLIHSKLDAVILGMHARKDNPELLKAQELNLTIYSYPEYLYEASKNKTRVVIGGSHGKTSITSMILHVVQHVGLECDYMVGAQLEGFDNMVKLTDSAKYIILEGDEYLSSPIDRRPKFHLYQPHIALLSGIAWDHINVFPTFDNYVDQFRIFIDKIEQAGSLIYYEKDTEITKLVGEIDSDFDAVGYNIPSYSINNGITNITIEGKEYPLEIFGEHNLQNLLGAVLVLEKMGIKKDQALLALSTFKGASKRLELVKRAESTVIYKDFAHSPSKLKATTAAMKNQFPDRQLVACMELHTFSSLSKEFLSHYNGAMQTADTAIVYYSPRTLEHKKLAPISKEMVAAGFNQKDLLVFTNSNELRTYLSNQNWNNKNLLLMSSGNFDGIDYNELAEELLN
ncbi:Mur ligase family protein [Salibacteraceae bacterium]|nr:Mur ligase family protein [Salibacteraceae bacterium]